MKRLAVILSVSSLCFMSANGQDKKGIPLPKPAQPSGPKVEKAPKTDAGPQGKVVQDAKADKLPKFKSEVTTPPSHKPPPRPGGSWHWHRWHGWVWLNVNIAPATVVLPVDFRLPASVVYYQSESVPLRIICPHCGQSINVYIQ